MKRLLLIFFFIQSNAFAQTTSIRDTLVATLHDSSVNAKMLNDDIAGYGLGRHITSKALQLNLTGDDLYTLLDTLRIQDLGVESNHIAVSAVGPNQIASTSVIAGTYTAASITVDADGRITYAANTPVGAGSDYADSVRIITGARFDWDLFLNSTTGRLDTTYLWTFSWPSYIQNHQVDVYMDTISLTLTALAFDSTASGGCPLSQASPFTGSSYWVMDDTNEDTVLTDFIIPNYCVKFIGWQVYGITNTTTNEFNFEFDWEGYHHDEAFETDMALLYGDEADITSANASGDLTTSDLIYVSGGEQTSLTGGDYVQIMVTRDGDDASDDATGDFYFLGLILYFTRSK